MRSAILTLFFITYLLSSDKTEYCIQIASFEKTPLKKIKKLKFPKECFIDEDNGKYFIRCECGDRAFARSKLPFYKKVSKGAFIVKRFKKVSYKKPKKSSSLENNKDNENKEPSLEELVYRVFVYTGDLKNAYRVVKRELAKNPNSFVWRKRAADLLLWMGKSKEALREYAKLYKKDKKLEKIVIKLSKDLGDYEEAYEIYKKKVLQNPYDLKNINIFITLGEKLGKVKETALVLDRIYRATRDPKILRRSALLYFELEDLKEAEKRFMLLYKAGVLKPDDAISLAKILFLKGERKKALQILNRAARSASLKDREFWSYLSEFYRLAGNERASIEILRDLCMKTSCQREDYDRLISYYFDKDPSLSARISLKAFREIGDEAFLFSFVKESLKENKPKRALKILNSLDRKTTLKVQKNPLFWLLKAKIYENLNDKKRALKFYEEALKRDPSSVDILSSYAFFLISSNNAKKLRNVLKIIEAKREDDPRLNVVAAMIYFKLGNLKKSLLYYKKALRNDPENEDLMIDYANLLMEAKKEQRAKKILRELFEKERRALKNNEKLFNNKEFLKRYLRVSLYFTTSGAYRTLLRRAKKVLSKKEYEDFELSFAIYKNRNEYLNYISNRLKSIPTWVKLYFALNKKDLISLNDLLYRKFLDLPRKGRIEALIATDNIGEARSEAFRALEEGGGRDIYKIKYNLDKLYGNRFDTQIAYEDRADLKSRYLKVANLLHLIGRYYLGVSGKYGKREYYSVFDEYEAKMWFKALIKSGYIKAGFGYRDMKEDYFKYFVELYKKLGSFAIKGGAYKNKTADESIDFILNGKKDELKFSINKDLNRRVALALSVLLNKYYTLDGIYAGKGAKAQIDIREKIRAGYPDISFRQYLAAARFDDKGVLPLPKDYMEGGVGVGVGRDFVSMISGGWRGYIDLLLSQNSLYGFSYAAEIGAGGKLFGRDNLNLSLGYNRSAGEFDEELWLFKIKHSYLY